MGLISILTGGAGAQDNKGAQDATGSPDEYRAEDATGSPDEDRAEDATGSPDEDGDLLRAGGEGLVDPSFSAGGEVRVALDFTGGVLPLALLGVDSLDLVLFSRWRGDGDLDIRLELCLGLWSVDMVCGRLLKLLEGRSTGLWTLVILFLISL